MSDFFEYDPDVDKRGHVAPRVFRRTHRDTTLYCKGKEGKLHQYLVCVPDNTPAHSLECRPWSIGVTGRPETERKMWHCQHRKVCQTCGKIANEKILCPEIPEGYSQSLRF